MSLVYERKNSYMITTFKDYLLDNNLSHSTIMSYARTVRYCLDRYGKVNKRNLLDYKAYLIDNCSPRTVNQRLQAINRYLDFAHKDELKLKFVKQQQINYLENVISNADYTYLKKKLKADGHDKWYFVVWLLGATGARVSELLKVKVEDVQVGFLDIYGKGGKIRRLYIPRRLRAEVLSWIKSQNMFSGYLFLNRFGERITARGIAMQLKHFAREYGIKEEVVYPHSFRHRFAKNFLAKYNDIALLADLMGHESIETTRIYLRRTATEQQELVDSVVDW